MSPGVAQKWIAHFCMLISVKIGDRERNANSCQAVNIFMPGLASASGILHFELSHRDRIPTFVLAVQFFMEPSHL